ncbi:hypothetical protein EOT10_39810 [Streptomyces antnestii]|uniref:Secreted protein/lipoprotein n=2 Tax=Streptomyces antnestii TaxID=2494256 RepID=A0A3S2V470_9ACTN|nr:hypothetical protein EOT10_39810 [Streptomyces sp. San01]
MGHSRLRRRNRNRIPILFVALAVLAAVSGCSSDDGASGGSKQPPSTPASHAKPEHSPSSDPNASQKKAVLAVYDAMSAEQAKAYHQASAKGTDLEKYASLDALSKIELDLGRMKEAGTVVRGKLGHDPDVKLAMDAKPPKATIKDCVDLSEYRIYDTKAKKVKPLPPEQPVRYVLTVKAERWDGGRWMVTDINPQGGPEC